MPESELVQARLLLAALRGSGPQRWVQVGRSVIFERIREQLGNVGQWPEDSGRITPWVQLVHQIPVSDTHWVTGSATFAATATTKATILTVPVNEHWTVWCFILFRASGDGSVDEVALKEPLSVDIAGVVVKSGATTRFNTWLDVASTGIPWHPIELGPSHRFVLEGAGLGTAVTVWTLYALVTARRDQADKALIAGAA